MKQRASLADMAKKAWDNQPAEVRAAAEKRGGEALRDFLISPSRTRDFWRREWQLKVTGKESMSDMDNADYDKLVALWLELAGDINGALRKTFDGSNELKQLRYRIRQACEKAGVEFPAYANAIAADKFTGRTIEQLNQKALLHVLYTVRNRKSSKRERSAE